MRLWVDDERVPNPRDWNEAKTSAAAIKILQQYADHNRHIYPPIILEEVSLDHDLGGEDTGMRVLEYMAGHGIWPKVITIHTANPPGRANLLRAANAEAPAEVEIFVKYW